jgi:tetratricopeptide (TPR) repeat protein
VKRVAILAAIGAFCAWVFVAFVQRPLACNQELNVVRGRTRAARDTGNSVEVAALAQASLTELRRMEGRCRTNIWLYTLEAENEDLLEQKEQAIAALRRGLAVDQRPELYMDIGDLLVDMGRTDEAVESYLTPVRLSSDRLANIPSPLAAERVQKRLEQLAAARPK